MKNYHWVLKWLKTIFKYLESKNIITISYLVQIIDWDKRLNKVCKLDN